MGVCYSGYTGPGPKTSRWWKMLDPICLYCLNCTKFGQLILRKIIKIIATRWQILRLKCTKFEFGWGSAPDPAAGAYSAPLNPLAGFKGRLRGREGKGKGRGKGGKTDGEGGEWEGKREGEKGPQREWEGRGGHGIEQGWKGKEEGEEKGGEGLQPQTSIPGAATAQKKP